MARIICWRSGEAVVSDHLLPGTISLMIGPRKRLQKLLDAKARHSHDGRTLLVPGVPEAGSDAEALDATIAFQSFLERGVRSQRAP